MIIAGMVTRFFSSGSWQSKNICEKIGFVGAGNMAKVLKIDACRLPASLSASMLCARSMSDLCLRLLYSRCCIPRLHTTSDPVCFSVCWCAACTIFLVVFLLSSRRTNIRTRSGFNIHTRHNYIQNPTLTLWKCRQLWAA